MTTRKPVRRFWTGISLGIIFLCVLGLWVATVVVLPRFVATATERGLFGDSFGAANALFSGLALFGVVVAIVMQGRALRLQGADLTRAVDAQQEAERVAREQAATQLRAAKLAGLSVLIQTCDHEIGELHRLIELGRANEAHRGRLADLESAKGRYVVSLGKFLESK